VPDNALLGRHEPPSFLPQPLRGQTGAAAGLSLGLFGAMAQAGPMPAPDNIQGTPSTPGKTWVDTGAVCLQTWLPGSPPNNGNTRSSVAFDAPRGSVSNALGAAWISGGGAGAPTQGPPSGGWGGGVSSTPLQSGLAGDRGVGGPPITPPTPLIKPAANL